MTTIQDNGGNGTNGPAIRSHSAAAQYVLSQAETVLGQFNREEIRKILPEIKRQAATKKDFVLPAPGVRVDADARLILNGVSSFKLAQSGTTFATWQEAEAAAAPGEKIVPQTESGALPMTRTALRQTLNRTNVPVDFWDRLQKERQGNLGAEIVNQRLTLPRAGIDYDPAKAAADALGTGGAVNGDRYLVRVLDGKARAVLSERYRIIDNIDLFFCAADRLQQVSPAPDGSKGADIWQMRLTDDSFSMLAVARGISGAVRLDRTYDPGDGWQSRWANLGGDIQYPAMRLTNSETGGGAVNVFPAVMTRVCANFNIWARSLKAVHLGKSREEDGLISAETQAAESRVIWLKVRDAIDTVFNADRFAAYIATLNEATQRNIVRDVADANGIRKAVERVAERFDIPEDRQNSIFAALMESRDFTQYGMSQAITLQAHGLDKAGAVEDAEEMETVGGALVHTPAGEFRDLVKV